MRVSWGGVGWGGDGDGDGDGVKWNNAGTGGEVGGGVWGVGCGVWGGVGWNQEWKETSKGGEGRI